MTKLNRGAPLMRGGSCVSPNVFLRTRNGTSPDFALGRDIGKAVKIIDASEEVYETHTYRNVSECDVDFRAQPSVSARCPLVTLDAHGVASETICLSGFTVDRVSAFRPLL